MTEGAPFWQPHISAWQQSGLTQKAYCEQQELRYSTFGYRCQPWRAKRRLVDPSSREAALFSRRALRQRENKVGLRTR
ncbi:IS66 family insertion sequence element accessory protein TnpA, partial [Thiolapillus sp.]|uniref:IS66 family insertion sequence element accessory protein TnpA n=1 Tax=Thiolapillus sp. TaxID=2017437 RepID=UPI003AF6F423